MVTRALTLEKQAFTHDRRQIDDHWLYILLAVGLIPFLLIGLRLIAIAGAGPLSLLQAGEWLNQHLTLQWVSYGDRDVVLYILLLPFAAFLVALTRLTLGIRVLGFRSILIAIGIQELGLLPSLLLIFLIAGVVILVRPSMKRSRMPLYARVAIVLCIVAYTMLAGLLAGAWLESATFWSMAFFPVVILAMLAESVADTVARDGLALAAWRTVSTIFLALLIAGINQLNALRELLLACPELLLTPLFLIVIVSEFFDLRLFQTFLPFKQTNKTELDRIKIAVVRNRFSSFTPQRSGSEVPRRYRRASLQGVIDQLRAREFDVEVLECDDTLPQKLRALAKTAFSPSGAGMCVLNYAGGIQGASRLRQVSVICESLGIPCSGPASESEILSLDRQLQMNRLRDNGVLVPDQVDYKEACRRLDEGRGPVWVRPRFEADRGAVSVNSHQQLRTAKRRAEKRFGSVMIEAAPSGTSYTVACPDPWAKEKAFTLPILTRSSVTNRFNRAADVSTRHRELITEISTLAARTLGCRGSTRIDLLLSDLGQVFVTHVHAIEPLSLQSAAGTAARLAGLSLADIAQINVDMLLCD